MKPVDDWKRAWRWLSMHVAGAAVVFGLLPADQQAAVLALLHIAPERVPAAIGLAFMASRMVNQTKRKPPAE